MENILSADHSATGTSGFCIIGSEISFLKIENKDWKEHFYQMKDLVAKHSINTVVYETTNYVSNLSKHMTGLFKLFGATEILPSFLPVKVYSVPVNQVKKLKEQIRNGQKGIAGLNYQRGKSWSYQGKNISVHELDAFLIYWIWKGNNY